ncbi:MAG: AsmA family protein, partial [Deltaproteobacteria bacterium]|nr:AsmA family protein [Deltaproteobacteria bacterium]
MLKKILILSLILATTVFLLGIGLFYAATRMEPETSSSLVHKMTGYRLELKGFRASGSILHPSLEAETIGIKAPETDPKLVFDRVRLTLDPAALLRGELATEFDAKLSDPSTLAELLPEELAAITNLDISGRAGLGINSTRLDNIILFGRNRQGLRIRAEGDGRINDFSAPQPFSRLALRIKIASPDTRTLAGYLPDDFPELGPVRGSLRLEARSATALAVDRIAMVFGKNSSLRLEIKGKIADIPVAPDTPNRGIELSVNCSAPAASKIGLTAKNRKILWRIPRSGPLEARFTISRKQKKTRIENLKIDLGRSRFTAELELTGETGTACRFSGWIVAPKIQLDELTTLLGESPEKENAAGETPSPAPALRPGKGEKPRKPIFGTQTFSLDWLDKCQGGLDIRIGEIISPAGSLRNLELSMKIDDRRLVVNPLSLDYEGGHARAIIEIDNRLQPPGMKLKYKIDDLDLQGAILSGFGYNSPLTGKLTSISELESRGASPHELAANLNGRIAMALENGRIPAHLLDLIAVDMLGWSFHRTLMNKKYAPISCGVLGLEIKQGTATCKTFVLEAPSLKITGTGT